MISRTLLSTVIALLLLALVSCSGGEVTVIGSSDADPAPQLSAAGQAIADEWGTEMGRNGSRIGSVTVSEGQCVANGLVNVLGEAEAQKELDAELASSTLSTTEFSADDADAMADHWAGCLDLTDYYTDLGLEIAPFAASGDLDCFATEMKTRSAALISSVLQGKSPLGTISAGAAQTCGLL